MQATIGQDLKKAKELLENGELVAVPTETVYGLAANALDEKAVTKIFEAKSRPYFDPLILHFHNIEEIEKQVVSFPGKLKLLAEKFSPGPITFLLEKKAAISDLVTAGSRRVAVRIPNHSMTLQLLKQLSFPLAAPSANPFGYISPTSAVHVAAQLGSKIPYILDGGSCNVGLESTIVGEENGEIIVYRLGGLSVSELEKVIGRVSLQLNNSSNPSAPGMLKSHYAPAKKLILTSKEKVADFLFEHADKKITLLTFGETSIKQKNLTIWNLSKREDMNEAAQNLFHFLREMDQSDAEMILATSLPAHGLGLAINDRLNRASVA